MNHDISSDQTELKNSAPTAFADAINAVADSLTRSALEGPPQPMPCTWLRHDKAGPPKARKESAEDPTRPAPEIQMQDSTQALIELGANGKQPPELMVAGLKLVEALPGWLQAEINSCPRRPRKGVYPWLYRVSRQLHAHLSPEEIFRLLWSKTRNVGRRVGDKEIRAQIASAAHTAWRRA